MACRLRSEMRWNFSHTTNQNNNNVCCLCMYFNSFSSTVLPAKEGCVPRHVFCERVGGSYCVWNTNKTPNDIYLQPELSAILSKTSLHSIKYPRCVLPRAWQRREESAEIAPSTRSPQTTRREPRTKPFPDACCLDQRSPSDYVPVRLCVPPMYYATPLACWPRALPASLSPLPCFFCQQRTWGSVNPVFDTPAEKSPSGVRWEFRLHNAASRSTGEASVPDQVNLHIITQQYCPSRKNVEAGEGRVQRCRACALSRQKNAPRLRSCFSRGKSLWRYDGKDVHGKKRSLCKLHFVCCR